MSDFVAVVPTSIRVKQEIPDIADYSSDRRIAHR
jgi:hypothetical protein